MLLQCHSGADDDLGPPVPLGHKVFPSLEGEVRKEKMGTEMSPILFVLFVCLFNVDVHQFYYNLNK